MNVAQTVLTPDVAERFRVIVGDKHAITSEQDKAPFLVEERGLYRGHSPLVLQPGSTAEVAAICKLASETRTAIVPQGGNTGLVGGQVPHHGEIVLSLRRLDKIRELDTQSSTITCEAGVILSNVHARAAEADRIFPLWLGSEGSCTIGGNLSTNAGGIAALSYGVARDLVVGLEVVMADGRTMHGLSKLKKDNTGYDLRNLFIGAEGTLGIITAASLKLFPKPRSMETAFVALASPQAALALLELSRARAASGLTSFELIARIAIEFSIKHGPSLREPIDRPYPWYVLMEVSSSREDARDIIEAILSKALEDGIIDDAVIAANLDQRQAFWALREVISPAQKPEGGSIKHDISVPIAAVPRFIEEADAAVAKLIPGARPVAFGHLGDGNIHYNVSQPIDADKAAYLARWRDMNDVVHALVSKHGGSISAEHGIGVLKRDELSHVKDPVSLDLMRTIKQAFDPLNILNPGKVL
ncbi:MAG: FAD-binding oxidoreductase [Xanthobacteraceae bacterium]|nr:FAD-binding oxidoreductase [Xanthobacteraceae bacterium]